MLSKINEPFEKFLQWYQEAKLIEKDADAMVLATCSVAGFPSARVVLYKGIANHGFLFYTNYHSPKAKELAENPRVALVFYWPNLYRQVRIEGNAILTSREDAEKYFATRPIGSQISAWASEQSKVIVDRDYLLKRHQQYQQQFAAAHVPCPEYWGGVCVHAEKIEFWQGQADRLHDRFQYVLVDDHWIVNRLAP